MALWYLSKCSFPHRLQKPEVFKRRQLPGVGYKRRRTVVAIWHDIAASVALRSPQPRRPVAAHRSGAAIRRGGDRGVPLSAWQEVFPICHRIRCSLRTIFRIGVATANTAEQIPTARHNRSAIDRSIDQLDSIQPLYLKNFRFDE